MYVCFSILVFGLFVSSHVGLYLIIVLLFLCQQFVLLPRHLITCCVNSLWLRHYSLPMMVLSGLLTCVDVCSSIWITAQVNTLHLGLCGLFSEGSATAFMSCFLSLPHCHLNLSVSPFPILFCSLFRPSFYSYRKSVKNNTLFPFSFSYSLPHV